MSEYVEILRGEYLELKCAELKLSMLESGGVDNWSWYWDSLEGFNEEVEKLKAEIFPEGAK